MTGLGQRLTEAREARGVALEQAERDTRIVRRYLTALEMEDFAAFPAEVYARGFLRSYATYLGLDAGEILALMPVAPAGWGTTSRRPAATPEQQTSTRRDRQPRPRAEPPGDSRSSRTSWPSRPARLHGLLIVAPAAFAVLVAAAIGQVAGGGRDRFASLGAGVAPPARSGAAIAVTGATVAGRMPDVRGLDEGEALGRLATLGVVAFVIEAPSREAPAGQVVRQSPAPNALIGRSTVVVVISRGG